MRGLHIWRTVIIKNSANNASTGPILTLRCPGHYIGAVIQRLYGYLVLRVSGCGIGYLLTACRIVVVVV